MITSEQFVIKNVYAVQKATCAKALMREVIGKPTGRSADMKPLDKVINTMTNNILPCGDKIKYCPLCEVLTDAIGYLKEYQQSEEIVKQILVDEENYPLSWEELKRMEGKPVFIEILEDDGVWHGEWCLIEEVNNVVMLALRCRVNYWGFRKITFGKTWQAYRKERE